jgi:hypothetical protein
MFFTAFKYYLPAFSYTKNQPHFKEILKFLRSKNKIGTGIACSGKKLELPGTQDRFLWIFMPGETIGV